MRRAGPIIGEESVKILQETVRYDAETIASVVAAGVLT
jgi:hypothetical protein